MSNHNDAHTSDDPVENVVKHIPLVIPAAGAVLNFLLAFSAMFMARSDAAPRCAAWQHPIHPQQLALSGFYFVRTGMMCRASGAICS